MADIQSAAAEIRRGKKKKEERRRTNHSMKIYMVSLFHRATIKKLRSGLVAPYDIRLRKGDGLFLCWCFINLLLTYLLRQLPTYLQLQVLEL